jgi:hypothetical protein
LASSPRRFGCSRSSISWPQSGTSSGIGRRGANSRHSQSRAARIRRYRWQGPRRDWRKRLCHGQAATFGIRTDLSLSPCSQEEIAAWAMCIIDAASDNRVGLLGCNASSGGRWSAVTATAERGDRRAQ